MTWKPIAYVIAAVVVTALLLWGLWSFDPFGRRKAAEQTAANATAQASITESGAKIADHTATNTARIHRAAGETQHALQASTDLDRDVAIWSDGVDGLRSQGHGADDHGGRQLPPPR